MTIFMKLDRGETSTSPILDNDRDNNMLNISRCVPQATDDHSVCIPTVMSPGCNKCVTIVEPSCKTRSTVTNV